MLERVDDRQRLLVPGEVRRLLACRGLVPPDPEHVVVELERQAERPAEGAVAGDDRVVVGGEERAGLDGGGDEGGGLAADHVEVEVDAHLDVVLAGPDVDVLAFAQREARLVVEAHQAQDLGVGEPELGEPVEGDPRHDEDGVAGVDGLRNAVHRPERRPVASLAVAILDVVVDQAEVVAELHRCGARQRRLVRTRDRGVGEQPEQGPEALAARARPVEAHVVADHLVHPVRRWLPVRHQSPDLSLDGGDERGDVHGRWGIRHRAMIATGGRPGPCGRARVRAVRRRANAPSGAGQGCRATRAAGPGSGCYRAGVPGRRLYVTDAIVLSRFDFGEADRILTLLTPEFGKIKAIAKGIRRPTSRIGGALEPLAELRVQLARGRTFDVVTQVVMQHVWLGLRDRLEVTATAWYCAELADRSLEERHSVEPTYLLLRRAFELLDAGMAPDRVARWYEMRLCEELGVRPEVDRCVECDRLLSPQDAVRWLPAQGGVLCSLHPGPSQASAGLTIDALKVLKGYQRMDVEALAALRLPPPSSGRSRRPSGRSCGTSWSATRARAGSSRRSAAGTVRSRRGRASRGRDAPGRRSDGIRGGLPSRAARRERLRPPAGTPSRGVAPGRAVPWYDPPVQPPARACHARAHRGAASRDRTRRRPERRRAVRPRSRDDREPEQAPRLHLPVVRDLRRHQCRVGLRAARGRAQEQRQARLVAGHGPDPRRHRRARLRAS